MKNVCGNIYQDRTERIFVLTLERSVDTQKSLLKFIKKNEIDYF